MRIILAVAVLCLTATAASADGRWRGVGILTAATGCPGIAVGTPLNVRFRPALFGQNRSSVTVLDAYYTQNYSRVGLFRKDAPGDVSGAGIGDSASPFENPPKLRILSQTPTTLTATTPVVKLRVDIRNFADEPGCNVVLDATLAVR